MRNLIQVSSLVAVLAIAASALDTTITYTAGRQYGSFKLDGRANTSASARTDVPDTVRFGTGLTLTRLRNKGEFCTLGCSYPVQTGVQIHVDTGAAGYRTGSDNVWNEALSFPAQLNNLDSINATTLSPCFGGGPYGLGLLVSSDDMSVVSPSGCADKSTFRTWGGHDRIIYFRNGSASLKLQVAGFEIDSTDCVSGHPLYKCTRGDKIVFRYVITDDSTGYFGTDPISVRGRESSARALKPTGFKAWKSDLYRMILGRRPTSSESR